MSGRGDEITGSGVLDINQISASGARVASVGVRFETKPIHHGNIEEVLGFCVFLGKHKIQVILFLIL